MKRLITENASSDAFRPTASIRNTAESEPKSAPSASRLPERKNERLLKRRGKSERHRPKLKFICLCEPDTMPFLNLREDTPDTEIIPWPSDTVPKIPDLLIRFEPFR